MHVNRYMYSKCTCNFLDNKITDSMQTLITTFLLFCLNYFSQHESNKVLKKVRQYLQQAGYVVEGVMGETSEAAGNEEFCPPKKKKKERKESSVGTSADTIKVQLVKPFVLKSDSLWHPSDDGEGNDDDNDDDDGDDDGDDDREKDSWGDGMRMFILSLFLNIDFWVFCCCC